MKRTLLLFTAAALMAAMMAIASPAQAQTFFSNSSNGGSSSNTAGFSNIQSVTSINSFFGGIDIEPSTVSSPGFEFTSGSID